MSLRFHIEINHFSDLLADIVVLAAFHYWCVVVTVSNAIADAVGEDGGVFMGSHWEDTDNARCLKYNRTISR